MTERHADVLADPRRLEALREVGLMDSPPEEVFDRLTRMASRLLGVRMALLSLVGEDRQFFLSASGLREPWAGDRETPLSHSFCQHVVRGGTALVVEDARRHPLVADNLAVRDLDVIAYAGVPLRLGDGSTVGALCAIDDRPRAWTDREVQTLEDLAAVALDAIELRRAVRQLDGGELQAGAERRGRFAERVTQACATATPGHHAAVLAFGVHGVRLINEALGRSCGDRLLTEVGHRLDEVVRKDDRVTRAGGTEFLVLCEGVSDEAEGLLLAERLRRALCVEPVTLAGRDQRVAVSVGLAMRGEAGEGEGLIDEALAALVRAESHGQATAGGADADADRCRRASSRLTIANALPGAQRRGEMSVVYQPLVNLASQRVEGFEALLRWEHPELGAVSPLDFIPVAEASGAIVALGEWVLDEACRDLAAWRAALPAGDGDLTVAVNVAGAQVGTPSLPAVVAAVLKEHGLPPGALTLELTERTLIDGRAVHHRTLSELSDHGVQLALDDFGIGYSALSYLTRFPIDTIKIDRSFVADIGRPRPAALVEAILAMADSLGLRTVAEGIEDCVQAQRLIELGCETGQGWFLGRPMSAAAAGRLLAG